MPEKPGPEKPGRFDAALVRELAAILREADLGEIEVGQGDWRIRVTRAAAPVHTPAVHAAAPIHQPAQHTPALAAAAAAPARLTVETVASHPGLVKSPMVGTVYLAPEKDADPFITVGKIVAEGATLLLVEAMKTFNPVGAPRAGRIKEILVTNEQAVEFGEPLVIIE